MHKLLLQYDIYVNIIKISTMANKRKLQSCVLTSETFPPGVLSFTNCHNDVFLPLKNVILHLGALLVLFGSVFLHFENLFLRRL